MLPWSQLFHRRNMQGSVLFHLSVAFYERTFRSNFLYLKIKLKWRLSLLLFVLFRSWFKQKRNFLVNITREFQNVICLSLPPFSWLSPQTLYRGKSSTSNADMYPLWFKSSSKESVSIKSLLMSCRLNSHWLVLVGSCVHLWTNAMVKDVEFCNQFRSESLALPWSWD